MNRFTLGFSKTTQVALAALGVAAVLLGFSMIAYAAAPNWDTTGNYVVDLNYLGTDYPHDMSLTQDGLGNLSGNGGSPAGTDTYTWVITSGTVSGDIIDFLADYTATADAVTPQTTLHLVGTIAPDGTISGTWSDNYAGGERTGAVSTMSGAAVAIPAPSAFVVTDPATGITSSDATLNGTNGDNVAVGHSFWVSTSTFSTASPTVPAGVYSTADLGPLAANTPFSAALSSIAGILPVTASTTYYFAAWSNVGGTWYPGEVLNFETLEAGNGQIGGTVTGSGALAVTSIEATDTSGTADGTYENGWSYLFHITIPTNETNVAMKFSNWTAGSSTMPVASNMRISSAQADNGGATVPVSAANTYTAPDLHMIVDLDPATVGIQVDIVVEVRIPVGTANAAYTTSYGVRSQ